MVRFGDRVPHHRLLVLHVVLLLSAASVAFWAILLVAASVAQEEAFDLLGLIELRPTTGAQPWLLVAFAAAGGHLMQALRGAVHHGYGHRDFDPGAALAAWAQLPVACFVALALLALGGLVLPGGTTGLVSAPGLALAALAGFFSEDTLHFLRKRFLKVLGRSASEPAGWGGPAVPDIPLGRDLQKTFNIEVPRAAAAVLQRNNIRTTRELAAVWRDPRARDRLNGDKDVQRHAKAIEALAEEILLSATSRRSRKKETVGQTTRA